MIIIWMALVYLVHFGLTEKCPNGLLYSTKACNTTCASLGSEEDSYCVGNLGPGCQCRSFVNSQKECVDDCKEDEVVCTKGNTTFVPIEILGCTRTCANMNEIYLGFRCDALGRLNECVCSKGYVLNAADKCILPQECDPSEVKCSEEFVFKRCGTGRVVTCGNEQNNASVCIPTCSCPGHGVFDEAQQRCLPVPKYCTYSKENIACMRLHGPNAEYVCDGCNCGCSLGYVMDPATKVCKPR